MLRTTFFPPVWDESQFGLTGGNEVYVGKIVNAVRVHTAHYESAVLVHVGLQCGEEEKVGLGLFQGAAVYDMVGHIRAQAKGDGLCHFLHLFVND